MIHVVFFSQTGNTEEMAKAVTEGIQAAGGEAKMVSVSDISAADLAGDAVYALGCLLWEMKCWTRERWSPFVEDLLGSVSGKKIGLFGSYDWGDGQWMRDWEARMTGAGAVMVAPPVICNNTPDEEGLANCKALGEALARA